MKSIYWLMSKASKVLERYYLYSLYSLGLNCTQANIIQILSEFEKQGIFPTQNELAKKLITDKVSIHQLLKKLEQIGYIHLEKNEIDNRCNYVKLTIKGRYIVPHIAMIESEIFSSFERQYMPNNKEEIKILLDKYIQEETN